VIKPERPIQRIINPKNGHSLYIRPLGNSFFLYASPTTVSSIPLKKKRVYLRQSNKKPHPWIAEKNQLTDALTASEETIQSLQKTIQRLYRIVAIAIGAAVLLNVFL
jgi:hypothetical protein